jgi:DNA polymerase-4
MHLDINSCFATIEQQANPLLRGKPVVVAAYSTPSGCILAASIEAKQLGIKTGMRVKEGLLLCRQMVVLESDPDKYRAVHLGLKQLLSEYTDQLVPKSIDEFVCHLKGYPAFRQTPGAEPVWRTLGGEIRQRIKQEVGDWIKVSIGFGPNRFLAKTASGLTKPEGLELIDQNNWKSVYQRLRLTDLCGIDRRNAARLNAVGIFTALEFATAQLSELKAAFHSVGSYYWFLRLRGWEIDHQPQIRRSFGNAYALPKPYSSETELAPILLKLTEKMSGRLRRAGYRAQGVHLGIEYRDGDYWHQGKKIDGEVFASADFYRYIRRLFASCPHRKPVRHLAVSCFDLVLSGPTQLNLFEDLPRVQRLTQALDKINHLWGEYTISPARINLAQKAVADRIGFGNVRELNENLWQQ